MSLVSICTGWCLTPTLLLICSSFSRENGHIFLICSSLSTAQCNFLRRGRNAFFWPLGEVVKMGSPFFPSFTSVGLGVEIFVTHQFF